MSTRPSAAVAVARALSPDFGYVLLSAAAIGIHYIFTVSYVGRARKRAKIEYPDMGCGRYAARLTDKQWLEFNIAQRVHYNYLEELPSVYTLLLLGGIFHPRAVAAATVLYISGRQLYAWGYMSRGPDGRRVGAILSHLGHFTYLSITIWGGLQVAGIV